MKHVLLLCMLFFCTAGSVRSAATDATVSAVARKKAQLLGMCFRHQAQLDLIEADLRKVEATIRKAQNLIHRAQAAHNAAAEQTATQALAAAGEATANLLKRKEAAATSLAKSKAMLALPDKELLALNVPEEVDDAHFKLALQREREQYETDYPDWLNKYQQLMRQNESDVPSQRSASILSSLEGKKVPLPTKKWPQLEPGDVILVAPENRLGETLHATETFVDNPSNASLANILSPKNSSGEPNACHTLVFLKEVNGKRFFLDNQPGEGPRIIPDDVFLERYAHRFLNKASFASRDADGIYVAERLKEDEAKRLWTAAMEAHQKGNQDRIVIRNPIGKDIVVGSDYGVFGNDMVCSEASRWALMRAGKQVPETESSLKKEIGVKFGPADFFDPKQPFLITPIGQGVIE